MKYLLASLFTLVFSMSEIYASEIDLAKTRLQLEQKCMLLARPGDILIVSNPAVSRNALDYVEVLTRTMGTYLPATIADMLSGRIPFQFARHAGVIHSTSFNEAKYWDLSFVRNAEVGVIGDKKTYYYEPVKRRSSGYLFTILRPKRTTIEHDIEVYNRMFEYETGERKASWCSASVNDIHQGLFEDVLKLNPFQQLGEMNPSPTRLLYSSRVQRVCQYQQGKGQRGLLYPESISVKDVEANIEYMRNFNVPQVIDHAGQLSRFLDSQVK